MASPVHPAFQIAEPRCLPTTNHTPGYSAEAVLGIIQDMGRLHTLRETKKPLAIDCFAGCGGMTEGFKQAGFRVVGAIENDPNACDVYAANHPRVRLWRND